jgi:hypothetical protein
MILGHFHFDPPFFIFKCFSSLNRPFLSFGWSVLQGNGHASPAQTTAYFAVNPGALSCTARVPESGYFPVLHMAAQNLGIARQDDERNFRL